MKKVPVLGDFQDLDQVNYDWPKIEILKASPDLKLSSMSFEIEKEHITWVRVILSDGQKNFKDK